MKSRNRNYILVQLIFLVCTLLFIQSCGDGQSSILAPDFSEVPEPFDTTEAITTFEKEGGLKVYVIEEGAGPFEVVPKDQVLLFFTGRTPDGKVFDSSYNRGSVFPDQFNNLTPFPQTDDQGRGVIQPLIEGFREGILGMKEGEKRVIVVPPSMGYSDSRPGTNGFDLRNDTLIFDLELDEIL